MIDYSTFTLEQLEGIESVLNSTGDDIPDRENFDSAYNEALLPKKTECDSVLRVPERCFYRGLDKDGNPDENIHIDFMKMSDVLADHFSIHNFMNILYVYDHKTGKYKSHVNQVGTAIRDIVKENAVVDRLSNVEKELMIHLRNMGCDDRYPFIGEFGTIHVKNGSLNLETGKISKSSPEMMYDYRIETEFEKFRCTPELDKFLSQYGTKEPIDVLAKCIWQRAYHDTLKELTVFYGPKDSGKTTLSELIQATIDGGLESKENVSRSLLHELLQRFGYSGLEGKLLNYGDDLPDMFIKNSGRVNTLVGSVVQHIEKKGKDGYDATVTAYHLFSANNLPPLDDDDNVIWGKIRLVEFKNIITSQRIPREKLFTETIKKQLLFRAIQKVIEWRTKPYRNSQDAETIRNTWHEASTDVDLFLLEATTFDVGAQSTLDDIKRHYDNWCAYNDKKRHIKYLQKKIQQYLRRQGTGNVYLLSLDNFGPMSTQKKI